MNDTRGLTPSQPIRAALAEAFNQLERCEAYAREIRSHIHSSDGAGKPHPDTASAPQSLPRAHAGSNELASRLAQLGDDLNIISSSF